MLPRVAAVLAAVSLSACTTSAPGATPSASRAASPQPTPQLTTYIAADSATALAWAPDKRLFYAERSGTIRTFDGTTRRTFATVSTSTDGERGLLGLALSPTFDKDHFVYAFYSRADDLTRQRVVRWLDRGGAGGSRSAPTASYTSPWERTTWRPRRRTRRASAARSSATTPTARFPATTRSARATRSGRSACAIRSASHSRRTAP